MSRWRNWWPSRNLRLVIATYPVVGYWYVELTDSGIAPSPVGVRIAMSVGIWVLFLRGLHPKGSVRGLYKREMQA
jgi:hypothetical protein